MTNEGLQAETSNIIAVFLASSELGGGGLEHQSILVGFTDHI